MSLTRYIDVSLINKIKSTINLSASFSSAIVMDGFEESEIKEGLYIAVENVINMRDKKIELNNNQDKIDYGFEIMIFADKKGELDDLLDFLLKELYGNLEVEDFDSNTITLLSLTRMSFKNENKDYAINGVNKFASKIILNFVG